MKKIAPPIIAICLLAAECPTNNDPEPFVLPQVTPVAGLSVSNNEYSVLPAILDASASSISSAEILTYSWTVNGERVDTRSIFYFRPELPGRYEIELTVCGISGLCDSITAEVVKRGPIPGIYRGVTTENGKVSFRVSSDRKITEFEFDSLFDLGQCGSFELSGRQMGESFIDYVASSFRVIDLEIGRQNQPSLMTVNATFEARTDDELVFDSIAGSITSFDFILPPPQGEFFTCELYSVGWSATWESE